MLFESDTPQEEKEEKEECPFQYIKHKAACYFFGQHADYKEALTICEDSEARLADVSPQNNKFLLEKLIFRGATDHWVGSYMQNDRIIKRKGPMSCPMMKGSGNPKFSSLSCNSAYPFICQKYGEAKPTIASENRPSRIQGSFGEEEEVVVVTERIITTSTKSNDVKSSNSAVLATLICIVLLIILAVGIRCYFRRSEDKKLEKKKKREANKKSLSKKPPIKTTSAFLEQIEGFKQKPIIRPKLESQLYPQNPPPLPERHHLPRSKSYFASEFSYGSDNLTFEPESDRRRRISNHYRHRRLPSPPHHRRRHSNQHQSNHASRSFRHRKKSREGRRRSMSPDPTPKMRRRAPLRSHSCHNVTNRRRFTRRGYSPDSSGYETRSRDYDPRLESQMSRHSSAWTRSRVASTVAPFGDEFKNSTTSLRSYTTTEFDDVSDTSFTSSSSSETTIVRKSRPNRSHSKPPINKFPNPKPSRPLWHETFTPRNPSRPLVDAYVSREDLYPMKVRPLAREPDQEYYPQMANVVEIEGSDLDEIIAQPLSMISKRRMIGHQGPITVQRQIFNQSSEKSRDQEESIYESIDDVVSSNKINQEDYPVVEDSFHENLPPLPAEFF